MAGKPTLLGDILRRGRERIGLNQSELAERVGIAANHVSRIESSEKAAPRFETVAKIASELGLSLDEISAACGLRTKTSIGVSLTAIADLREELRRFSSAISQIEEATKDATNAITRLGQKRSREGGGRTERPSP